MKKSKTKKTMSADDKHYRRLRNREHAKLSRWRKRMLIATLEETVRNLQNENDRLACIIQDKLPDIAETLLLPQNKDIPRAEIPTTESIDLPKDEPHDMYDIDFINIL
jgi:hypothetical protein